MVKKLHFQQIEFHENYGIYKINFRLIGGHTENIRNE